MYHLGCGTCTAKCFQSTVRDAKFIYSVAETPREAFWRNEHLNTKEMFCILSATLEVLKNRLKES